MIKEDYVSFETAKLLKEKGFDSDTDYIYYYYESDGEWCFERFFHWDKFDDGKMLHAPTQQGALTWLTETFGIYIDVRPDPNSTGFYLSFYKNNGSEWIQAFEDDGAVYNGKTIEKEIFPRFENAMEYGLVCCLKKL